MNVASGPPRRTMARLAISLVFAGLALASCGSDAGDNLNSYAITTEAPVSAGVAELPTGDSESPAMLGLVERPGPRRETTGDVPHMQIAAAQVASVDAELKRLVFLETREEVDIAFGLVVATYNFVVGAEIDAPEIG